MSITFPTNSGLYGTLASGGNLIYTTSTGIFGASVVHVFTATGTSYFTATAAIATAAYLVVAGGGGGGCNWGGGGGAGGLLTGTFVASSGTTYVITVGAGGAPKTSGTNSSITGTAVSVIAIGGGLGNGGPTAGGAGGPGGSGGGSGTFAGGAGGSGTPGQGNPAAPGTGGGGGGGAGSSATSYAGGIGLQSAISGTANYYAGGGGGWNPASTPTCAKAPGGLGGGGQASFNPKTPGLGTPGTPNTGGGGGGGSICFGVGGSGGPGIVVLSYNAIRPLYSGFTFSTSTYLGTETWTYSTATQRWFSTQEPSQQYTLTPSLIEDQATTSTGYIDFPYGTTAQRPQGPTPGYMRFNTDLGLMEYWNTAGTWVQIPAQNT